MREKTLSTRYFKTYKTVMLTVMTICMLAYVISLAFQKNTFGMIMSVFYFGMAIFVWLPSLSKTMKSLKQIAYDKENLVVYELNQQIIIPLEQIKEIELVSLDGLYKFSFYQSQAFGNELLCKSSIWYPFNFSKVDKELDYIRYLVRRAKQRAWQAQPTNQLTSNTPVNL